MGTSHPTKVYNSQPHFVSCAGGDQRLRVLLPLLGADAGGHPLCRLYHAGDQGPVRGGDKKVFPVNY